MKKHNYLFIIVFVISSFLFICDIKADYKATVINPSGAKCNLRSGSTGYCYYKDSNLNSYVSGVVWLDTGDEVTVLTNADTVPTKDSNVCKDYYVKTTFYFSATSSTYTGYYCNANLTTGTITDAMKTEFTNAGFPESYFSKLAILRQAHPNWQFRAIKTELDFNESVRSLNIAAKSLVQKSSSNNYAYMATDSTSFDYKGDRFIPYDAKSSSNAWYNANYDTIAYYLDPRNFLSDMYIFQFEGLSYDNSISDTVLTNTINEVFKNDYLNKFTNNFISAGKESKVSPVYLASLAKQEVGGSSSANSAISGKVAGYENHFNFYNIGATSDNNPVLNGLTFAKGSDESVLRPWNTEYRAIVGGAKWIAREYIGVGQDTSYFKKYNVVYHYLKNNNKVSNPYANFTHHYMTNIMAPSSEARTTYKSYYATGILDSVFTFYIPVYNNMPTATTLPTKTGWPNNYLSKLTINGNNVADFDGSVTTYNYYLDANTTKVTIGGSSVSSKATISGFGTFDVNENTTKIVKVTAENKDIKEYKINIILTGEKTEESKDVVSTLNNAGIKNGDKYLSGFDVGADISTIKTKIKNSNNDAIVKLTASNGTNKESGTISTGDKVTVTVNGVTKEYEVVIYGDASGDGKISAVDYVKIKNNIMGTSVLSGSYKEAADVDKNGKVSAVDYVKIKNKIMGTGSISQ